MKPAGDPMPNKLPSLLLCLAALTGCVVVPVPTEVAKTVPFGVTIPIGGGTAKRAAGPVPQEACARPAATRSYEAAVLAEVNSHRASAGLPALRRSARISAIAQNHACDNARRQTISHHSSSGKGITGRLSAGGYSWRLAAENTGLGFVDSPQRMVQYWMDSPGHRANILRPGLTEAGLGYAGSTAKPAWVLNLATPR